jgi:hypothetical protein
MRRRQKTEDRRQKIALLLLLSTEDALRLMNGGCPVLLLSPVS